MYDNEPPEGWRTCAICGHQVKDLLVHLRVNHEIRDLEDFVAALDAQVKSLDRKLAFRRYVEDLKGQVNRGEITAADYRRLIVAWNDSAPQFGG